MKKKKRGGGDGRGGGGRTMQCIWCVISYVHTKRKRDMCRQRL